MNSLNKFLGTTLAFVLVCTGAVSSAFALGFRNPDQSARATAQGEAFVGQADDPSAIYYNPGGLTQLTGTYVSVGSYILFRQIDFHGPTANENMNAPGLLPHFYAVSDLGLEKWRFGLGLNVPYGLDVDWGNKGSLRFLVTEARLSVLNIEPTVAYLINDHLSFGLGVNVYYGDTSIENNVFFAPPPVPEGRFKFDGDGEAAGVTLGLLWKINEQHTVGVVYRSPFSIDFDGSVVIRKDPTGSLGRSDARTKIEFPQSVAVGYAFRPIPKLKLEVDVEWTNWDTLNTVVLKSSNPGFNGMTIPFNWMDSFFYEVGAQYQINDSWVVRAGYIYSENSVPQSTFSPLVPDSNRHVISTGVGFAKGRLTIDVTYQYSYSEDRTISPGSSVNSPFVDGKWESYGNAVMVTSTLKF